MDNSEYSNIDDYIQKSPEHVRPLLEQMRTAIRDEGPDLVETISYGMPAFKGRRILVYFARNKTHIGFYPTASGIKNFSHEFGEYKWSKGAVQFPIGKPLPLDLVKRIVRFRIAEDGG